MGKPFLSTTLREKPKPVRPRSAHALVRGHSRRSAPCLAALPLPLAHSLTLKASLASAMIARWQLLCMRSACGCAQPIPSNALIAHQQPCLPPARLHMVAQRSAQTPSFPLVALMPHACSFDSCHAGSSGSVSTRLIVGSRSGPHTSTYPPHCPQLLIKLPAVWTKRDN